MNTYTILLFSMTVLPLICTPGPDILLIASQSVSGGRAAGLRATCGVVLGYSVHALLVALGLAALVAASPVLFETIRWMGISYLVYLAYKLIRSALRPGNVALSGGDRGNQLFKGFLTSLLNPKGLMMYIAILPQFMDHQSGNATLQAATLSAAFIILCTIVYASISIALGHVGEGGLSSNRRRQIDGTAGAMVLIAAGFMAAAS